MSDQPFPQGTTSEHTLPAAVSPGSNPMDNGTLSANGSVPVVKAMVSLTAYSQAAFTLTLQQQVTHHAPTPIIYNVMTSLFLSGKYPSSLAAVQLFTTPVSRLCCGIPAACLCGWHCCCTPSPKP